jgi:lysophospholipase L1-like esterase
VDPTDPSIVGPGNYVGTVTASTDGYGDDVLTVNLDVGPALPIAYDFESGGEANWTEFEDSGNAADWQVAGGRLQQLNNGGAPVGGGQTYIRGTYALLNTNAGLSDFEFTAEIIPRNESVLRRGDGVGLMFRYVDDDNYYRISVDSRFGNTRLERKLAGIWSTMAVSAQGYLPASTLRLGVRVSGPAILVYRDYGGLSGVLDGEPYMAAYDMSLSTGGVALYTKSEADFDNVEVRSLDGGPRVGVAAPRPYGIVPDGTIEARAVVLNPTGSDTVEFELDTLGCGAVTEPAPGLFASTCTAAANGEHAVEAILKQSGVETDRDSAGPVGTGGELAVVLGDSINFGFLDNVLADNIGEEIVLGGVPMAPRQVNFRGYHTPLHEELNDALGLPYIFYNESISGATSDDLAVEHLPSILERQPATTLGVLMVGTNDASSGVDPAAYEANLQTVVDTLQAAGVKPVIARILPIFGRIGRDPFSNPLSSTTPNVEIQAYNAVIDALIAAETSAGDPIMAGPDLWAYFLGDGENRVTLTEDNYHPNALGYRVMARLWREVFAPVGQMPLVLTDFCIRVPGPGCQNPVLYKQNILELGNPIYVDDETLTLTSIPAALADGVWIETRNADRAVTATNYLSFFVDRDVDVYVAYTSAATSLPDWLGAFSATAESIGVAGGPGSFDLYSTSIDAGAVVTIGGNQATGAAGSQDHNLFVIVVPR